MNSNKRFIFSIITLFIIVMVSDAHISDVGIFIQKNNDTAFVNFQGSAGYEYTEIPIMSNKQFLFQKGIINLSPLHNLDIILPNSGTVIVEINFDKMKLFKIDAPNIIILQQIDHIAFGSSVIVELPTNKFSNIRIKYSVLKLAPGELYCLILIILAIISLITTIIFFGIKKLILLTTIIIIMSSVIMFWMFLKFWQAF